MSKRMKNLFRRLSKKRKQVALVILWAALVALVVIRMYWTAYNESARLSTFKIPFLGYEGPRPTVVDVSIVFVVGIIFGFVAYDVEDLLYGYIAAMLIAFIISFAYVTLYIWYVLDLGKIFSVAAYDWEWALYVAFSNVLVMMFPWIVGACFLGLVIGSIVKTW